MEKLKDKSKWIIRGKPQYFLGGVFVLFGFLVFQYFGNSTRGYIDTSSTLVWWGKQWMDPASDLQHSPFLVLFVVAFSAYRYQVKFRQFPMNSELWTAFLYLSVGLFLNNFGFFVQQTRFNCVGFLLYLLGICHLLGGYRLSRAVAFPLLFMVFALPFQFLQDEVGYYLRSGVIQVSAVTVDLLGIELQRNGTILSGVTRPFVYDVAPACSGMRSLLILSAISFAVGGIVFDTAWRRLVLLAVALPLAFFGNWIRVSSILLGGYFGGQETGMMIHDSFGFVVFVVVLGGALGLTSLIESKFPENKENSSANVVSPFHGLWLKGSSVIFLMFSLWLSVLSFTQANGGIPAGIKLDAEQMNPLELPSIVGSEWVGQSEAISDAEKSILPQDTGFARKVYTDWNNNSLLFSIILSGQDRSSIHRPEICLAAQGFTIYEKEIVELNTESEPFEVTLLKAKTSMEGGEDWEGLFAYWFVNANGAYPTHVSRTIAGIMDRLKGSPSRWAYLLVQVELDEEEKALKRIEGFVDKILPEVLSE